MAILTTNVIPEESMAHLLSSTGIVAMKRCYMESRNASGIIIVRISSFLSHQHRCDSTEQYSKQDLSVKYVDHP
jgi:hypothetical protein